MGMEVGIMAWEWERHIVHSESNRIAQVAFVSGELYRHSVAYSFDTVDILANFTRNAYWVRFLVHVYISY